MIPFLTAAVVALAVLTGLNLVLCFAIIRRLRAAESADRPAVDPDLPAVGTVVAPFSVTAVDGSPISHIDFLDGEWFVGLLQPGCPACKEFVTRLEAGRVKLPERATFMIAETDPADTGAYAAQLARHACAYVAGVGEPGLTAFGEPSVFPTFLQVVNGVVIKASLRAETVLKGMHARASR